MSITDCHLSIQTFWRCKYSVLRSAPGCTDSLSTRVRSDGQSMLLTSRRGEERKKKRSLRRGSILWRTSESRWGGVGGVHEERRQRSRPTVPSKSILLDNCKVSTCFSGKCIQNVGNEGELMKLWLQKHTHPFKEHFLSMNHVPSTVLGNRKKMVTKTDQKNP